MNNHSRQIQIALAAVLVAGMVLVAEAAKIKIKAEPDPAYDFATVKTWAWDADAGEVMMARTPMDDPAAVKQRVDPLIRKFVAAAMAKKGLTDASTGTPAVQLHYYVLVTVSQSGQYMGQFLPSVAYWGLPPFAPQSTSLDVATKGSLVLDAMLPGAAGERKVVWRGMAQSTLDESATDATREARIREACEGLIEKFPLKKKK
jgi:Domain of unknown function (DUF4136)